jgi:hypothetical protein
VSKLIRDRQGFQLHAEYGTDPSVYYIDYKLGGALSNKAPECDRTGSHMQEKSTVYAEVVEKLAKSSKK